MCIFDSSNAKPETPLMGILYWLRFRMRVIGRCEYALLWMKCFTVYAQNILMISLKTRFLVPEIEVTCDGTEYDFSQVPHHWNIFLLNLSRPMWKRYFWHRRKLQPELPLFVYRIYGTRWRRRSGPTEWLHTRIWKITKRRWDPCSRETAPLLCN